MQNKFRKADFVLWICIALIFGGCHFIKTVKVPVDHPSLSKYVIKRPTWTIEDASLTKRAIGDLALRHDSIFGRLYPYSLVDHPGKGGIFQRSKGPYSLSFMHLNATSQIPDAMAIPLSSITSASTHKRALAATGGTNLLIATGITVVLIAVLCNCPHVEVIGSEATVFQGSLFPGAISKSLERSDNLVMRNVPPDQNGNIHVRISNDLPEIEYFNSIELFEVTSMEHDSLVQHTNGQLVTYDLQDHLVEARTPERVITDDVQSVDAGFYDFKGQGNDYELNKTFLTFDKTTLGNDGLLIIRARQSKWMETVGGFTIEQFGKAYDKWVEKLDNVDPATYNQNTADRGISMNAYIKHEGRWDYLGAFANAGTLGYRTMALNVDLSAVNEKTVEIKLEAAHGFWDLDYVGMTDKWSKDVSLAKLDAISAFNQSGEDVMQAVAADDGSRTTLATEGQFLDLRFASGTGHHSTFVLKGKGYYHHERNYTSKPNYRFLNAVRKDKMTTHQLSRLLESQLEIQAKQSGNR